MFTATFPYEIPTEETTSVPDYEPNNYSRSGQPSILQSPFSTEITTEAPIFPSEIPTEAIPFPYELPTEIPTSIIDYEPNECSHIGYTPNFPYPFLSEIPLEEPISDPPSASMLMSYVRTDTKIPKK